MKKILLLLLLTTLNTVCAQEYYFWPIDGGILNPKNSTEYYTIELPEKDSIQIYNAILENITKNFDRPKEVIVADKKFNYIKLNETQIGAIGKGNTAYDFKYTIEIEIKKGRYRFKFSDILMTRESTSGDLMMLLIKSKKGFFDGRAGGLDKFLLTKKGKPSPFFYDEFLDLVKETNRLSKVLDVTGTINAVQKDW